MLKIQNNIESHISPGVIYPHCGNHWTSPMPLWSRCIPRFIIIDPICPSSGHGPGVPESTPTGFCVFLSDRIRTRSQKFLKNRTRIQSRFSISAVAGVCVVICEVKPLVILGCLDCSRSLNRSRIFKFEKFPDPDPDSKVLEQERSRSLKKRLHPPLICPNTCYHIWHLDTWYTWHSFTFALVLITHQSTCSGRNPIFPFVLYQGNPLWQQQRLIFCSAVAQCACHWVWFENLLSLLTPSQVIQQVSITQKWSNHNFRSNLKILQHITAVNAESFFHTLCNSFSIHRFLRALLKRMKRHLNCMQLSLL